MRCLDDLPLGSFVCCYAGQLLTEEDANKVLVCTQNAGAVVAVCLGLLNWGVVLCRRDTDVGMSILLSWITLVGYGDVGCWQ